MCLFFVFTEVIDPVLAESMRKLRFVGNIGEIYLQYISKEEDSFPRNLPLAGEEASSPKRGAQFYTLTL